MIMIKIKINGVLIYTMPLIINILAGAISWFKWHSIGWMLLHGLLGWIYFVYLGFNLLFSRLL